ncbi:MAG: CotH kinase family protein [Bacteroidales bacterium]|nr:CotH kinase family protein [Bacteroidales bacterium]
MEGKAGKSAIQKSITVLIMGMMLFCHVNLYAQTDFYCLTEVQQIRINFYEPRWKAVLDSLFTAANTEIRLPADVSINGKVYHQCGIRYKGFSSWNANETKNPFNIDLDFVYKNQNHQGYTSLKLSNVIYDPSFLREVLAYDIARQYMPASQANFAELYVNDTLIGLYTSVEAVNDEFISKFYGNDNNTFFKGSPFQLSFPFGQNANLNYYTDSDSSGYTSFYKMESEYGWSRLYDLIYTLCNDTANLSEILNIDQALWMHAFNYTVLNLDSYIAYAQNYYMYEDDYGRFNPIVWDLNMSFGSFRLSDGSVNYQGVTIPKLKILNPLQHVSFSISPRPLMKMLFSNSRYKKMYLAHIRTIVNQNIANNRYLEQAEALHEIIEPYVLRDTNKFYPDTAFRDNLYISTGSGSGQFPGLQDLMQARANYLSTYTGVSGAPEVITSQCLPVYPVIGDTLNFRITVTGANHVFLYYRSRTGAPFVAAEMSDDGLHNDDEAGDNVFGFQLVADEKSFQYYFWTENNIAGAFLPEEAAFKYFDVYLQPGRSDIVMNEICYPAIETDNKILSDSTSFIEIYNNTAHAFKLTGMSLRQNNNCFFFGDTVLQPASFLVVEADALSSVSDTNTGFYINESPLLFCIASGLVIDSLMVVCPHSIKSQGRYPNGNGSFCLTQPTVGATNRMPENYQGLLSVFPNPASDFTCVEIDAFAGTRQLIFTDATGRVVFSTTLAAGGLTSLRIDVSCWKKGIYFVFLHNDEERLFKKLILL